MEIEDLPEDSQIIARMWNDNKSGAQIAMELGTTRNAVLGKIFRIRRAGYNLRQKQYTAPVRVFKPIRGPLKRPGKPVVLKKRPLIDKMAYLHIKPEPEIIDPLNITITKLKPNSCRYIRGETNGTQTIYCGIPRHRGAYCKAHAKLCYVPMNKGTANDKSFAAQSALAG